MSNHAIHHHQTYPGFSGRPRSGWKLWVHALFPEPVHGRIQRQPILGGLICECRCGAPGWRTTRLVRAIAA